MEVSGWLHILPPALVTTEWTPELDLKNLKKQLINSVKTVYCIHTQPNPKF
jgi:hypothetical protein